MHKRQDVILKKQQISSYRSVVSAVAAGEKYLLGLFFSANKTVSLHQYLSK